MIIKALVKTTKAGEKRIMKAASTVVGGVNEAISDATLAVHEEAVRGIMKQSPGESQIRYNPKRRVTASKPGDPPNVDLGTFVRSVQFDVDLKNGKGQVGTNDKRGPWFEFGTKNMAKHPWLTPALKNATKKIQKIFRNLKGQVK